MTSLLVGLVLTAALLHAVWNAMAKSGGHPEYSIAAYQLVGSVVCIGLSTLVPIPARESWPLIFISVIIHNFYYFSLAQAYRVGDLSQVYPLFRGLAPVLVAFGAVIFADEWLSPGTLAGIVIVSGGVISLAFRKNSLGAMPRKALFWGLTTSFLIACYTVVDGLGVRVAGNSMSYILWLFIFEVVPIGFILLLTRRQAWIDYMCECPLMIIGGGVASSTAYGLVIFAMSLGAMAVVSSLRETSVIFAAVIGSIFLREPFGSARIRAATLVASGIILMRVIG
jgi:drug/metabolite transporter (DMT)-like permease